uniref:non-specific serine/threonine protein kinase n=1 Tax=Chenopodium quinoa TaxID=63459 RepID=A0A803M1P8_CHEQI
MTYDGPEISSLYWPSPDFNVFKNGRTNYNSTRVASFNDEGTFVSSDMLKFSATDLGLGVKRRLTMDYDGNLRLYSLNTSSGLWFVTWQAIVKQCNIHGLCGRNGICIYTPQPKCSCPPHFEPISSRDWSKGCRPKFDRSSHDSHFVEVPNVDYYGFDLNATENVTYIKCKNLCLRDYRCQAFKYIFKGTMRCLTKGALFNGLRAKDSLHIRMPIRSQPLLEPKVVLNASRLECGGKGPRIVPLPNTYYDLSKHNFRKHGISASLEEGYRTISSQFRSFSYNELKKATNKFKQVLGRGGLGAVYKGVLTDARVVAVKKLENIVQGEEEFWAEVSTFGRINHMNLARMWGFCSQGKNRLLVYERFKIALGTAKGLAYLHHECLEWVIHCDVKPENILLDTEFEPKISDFGLAKLCQRGGDGLSELSKIRGTKGYMAPEWTTNLPLTAKVDVYSYGVVILELVRGIRMSSCMTGYDHDDEETPELKTFARSMKRKMQEGDEDDESWMMDFVDPRLEGKFNKNQAAKMIEIGLLCVEDDRNKRPTMESVVQFLAECVDKADVIEPLSITE